MSDFGLPLFDRLAPYAPAKSGELVPQWHAPAKASAGDTWCGPYAIAVVAGLTYDRSYSRALNELKKRKIVGMRITEVKRCLASAGIRTQLDSERSMPTLTQWVKRHPKGEYLVLVTGHFVVVKDGRVICGISRKWETIADRKDNKRSRVRAYLEIISKDGLTCLQ